MYQNVFKKRMYHHAGYTSLISNIFINLNILNSQPWTKSQRIEKAAHSAERSSQSTSTSSSFPIFDSDDLSSTVVAPKASHLRAAAASSISPPGAASGPAAVTAAPTASRWSEGTFGAESAHQSTSDEQASSTYSGKPAEATTAQTAVSTAVVPNVVQVSAHRIIKGPCYPCELEALLYVRKHTTIPVPRVYRTYAASEGRVYIEMELAEGASLAELWRKTGLLTDDDKASIMADLHDAVVQLRSLPPPPAGSTQQGLSDGRIGPETFGPFASHDEFHTYGDAVFQAHSKHYKTYFTHADLVPRNIIIKNGRIAAIVDWGFAGWYPEYWEYTKIHFDAFIRLDWYKAVKEAIPTYDTELAAERSLWQQFDEPGVPRRY
ncbi:hypothetical protein SCUCBS95973_002172 [Sporothrix curviconia]|uniref:Aminoglycoside phosphotransferase domain-containing protein n=1 Tax=Sporothrix curviconia TaxID=1260050 RepID=A0ABP0B4M8_9PEZI